MLATHQVLVWTSRSRTRFQWTHHQRSGVGQCSYAIRLFKQRASWKGLQALQVANFFEGCSLRKAWYKKRSAIQTSQLRIHQHCLRWNLSVCHWFWASGCLGPRFQETDGACEASDKDQASHLPRRQRLANGNVLGDLSPHHGYAFPPYQESQAKNRYL